MEELTVGAYPWTVRQVFDKERFKNLTDMRIWERSENKKFLDGFNGLIGTHVIVTVGNSDSGKMYTRKYKGLYEGLFGSTQYGYSMRLQQKKAVKMIEGWQVMNVESSK